MLHIYNTMTGKKEPFKQITPDGVRMYVCGVTVYDLCHIGHARSSIVFDVIRRSLEWKGMNVIFVKNFTDIDDKIINKANQTGQNWKDIAEEFIIKHDEDMKSLGVLPPTYTPRATEFIPQMIFFCERLIELGHAYAVGGDVYFRVKSFSEYGKLSKKNIDDLQAGSRIDINDQKENPLDFALWKSAKPGEPSWESPWGAGRPGWHLECSVMSEALLGVPIDIHGGGHDLIFPHHENEIAQSESMCGCDLSRFWVHNGFVNINKEKMSKSLGNFFTIRDILKDENPEVLRFFLLTTHYRQPLEFSDSKLREAESALERIYTFKDELKHSKAILNGNNLLEDIGFLADKFSDDFETAINDDFNTPSALAALFEAIRQGNKMLKSKPNEESLKVLNEAFDKIFQDVEDVLYVAYNSSESWYKSHLLMPEEDVEKLIYERNEARKAKNFTRSDDIRNDLLSKGIEIIDTNDGTRYRTKIVHKTA